MIDTKRLFMRQFSQDDLPWLIENRSPVAVNRFLGGMQMQSPEALTVRLEFYIQCYEKFGFGMCAMGLKETGELIGSSGLQPLEDTGEIEVGYNLSEKYWRQGFGYESAMGWLKHGFEIVGLERIVAVCHPDNIGSWKIMEKCGMRYEKTAFHYGGDLLFYAISREEFANHVLNS
jgi:ribosomal-protein-alanine N-acetyltransferase